MKEQLFIGVDGGGTRTRAVTVNRHGQVLACAEGDGINYHNIGLSAARKNLLGVVERLLALAGKTDFDQMAVGLSALDQTADAETVKLFAQGTFDAEKLVLESDAYIALMGATLGESGVIAICGTGSMLLLLDDAGEQHPCGGWGYLLGDSGSAYHIATDALRAAIDAWEDVGEETALCTAALTFFHVSQPRQIIDRMYAQSNPGDTARFAKEVLEIAASDKMARRVVEQNLSHFAFQAGALMRKYPNSGRVGLYGGVFQHSAFARDFFSERLSSMLPGVQTSLPAFPPESGAVIHLLRREGLWNAETHDNLQKYTFRAE